MENIRQINIEGHPYYFYNDTADIKKINSNLLGRPKLSSETTDEIIYDIKYYDMKSLNTEDLPYLIFNDVGGYIEESSGDKYLILASTDKNKEVLTKYTELWNEIKNQIETINGGKPIKNERDFMKIGFKTGDNLPLNEILNIPTCIIDTTCDLQEDNKYYPQAYLKKCLYQFVNKPVDNISYIFYEQCTYSQLYPDKIKHYINGKYQINKH